MMKRLITAVLIAFMFCSLFSACAEKEVITEDEKIVKINGKIMSNKVYEYYFANEKLNNPDDSDDVIKAAAVKNTARQLYISEMCADKGIEINDEGRNTIDSQINSLVEQYGSKEAFEKDISQYGLDYDTYYALTESAYLENLLKAEIIKT